MKKLIIVLLTTCLSLSLFSQDLRVGFEFSKKKPIYTNSLSVDNYTQTFHNKLSSQVFAFSINYTNKNNLVFGTGIGFSKVDFFPFYLKRNSSNSDNSESLSVFGTHFCKVISVPLNIGYKYDIAYGLYLKYMSGLEFDLYYDRSYGGYGNLDSPQSCKLELNRHNTYKQKYSILFSNSLNIGYEIKNRVYIELFAAYHAGTQEVLNFRIDIRDDNNDPNIFLNRVHSKGSYYNVGIGVGYILARNK